jgi:hypothetical protein
MTTIRPMAASLSDGDAHMNCPPKCTGPAPASEEPAHRLGTKREFNMGDMMSVRYPMSSEQDLMRGCDNLCRLDSETPRWILR